MSKNTHNAKQKNISDTTKRMLLKGKALGNTNIPSEDRLYLQVSSSCLSGPSPAPSAQAQAQLGQGVPRSDCVFISTHKTVAEALHDIQLLLPSLAGGKGKPNLTLLHPYLLCRSYCIITMLSSLYLCMGISSAQC